MKKCVFIIPYFGQFKNYFSIFLESCAYNKDFNWIVFTDNEDSFDWPSNVKKIQMTFEEIKSKIQDKFDFKISLDAPYKLCDYKPAYGYVFEEMIKEYDYWGYCDCDLVFGSMDDFLSGVLEAGYDKLFAGGHCTIYKNTCENNRRFMTASSQYGKLYRQAFTSERIFAFDEMCYGVNVHTLFLENAARVWTTDFAFNISTESYMFRRKYFNEESNTWIEEPTNSYIVFDRGHLYASSMNKKWKSGKEYLYAHFQGRMFSIDDNTKKNPDAKIVFMPGKIFYYNGYPSFLTLLVWNVKCVSFSRLKEYCRKVKRHLFNPKFIPVDHNPYEEKAVGISAIE